MITDNQTAVESLSMSEVQVHTNTNMRKKIIDNIKTIIMFDTISLIKGVASGKKKQPLHNRGRTH